MESALRRGLSGKSCAASAPTVEKDSAPNTPARMRQSDRHQSAGSQAVASRASAVVTSPKANRRDGLMREISTMVSTAPAI
jgi:hypothetical protein